MRSYTTALKNKPFTLAYIDAFAGTGYLLCFAAANPNGATVALRIANHLLAMGSR